MAPDVTPASAGGYFLSRDAIDLPRWTIEDNIGQSEKNKARTDALEGLSPAEDIARRMARFKRTRNPSDLWPGLTEWARVAAARELERVTRAVLAGETAVQVDRPGCHDTYALHIAGHTSGMGPVMGVWAERGIVGGSSAVMQLFFEQLRHSRLRAARMEREVLPALDALAARGITPLVLKGFHTARVYFEEPGARRMADIDIWVPKDRIHDAEAALRDAGFRPDSPASLPFRRDWIGVDVDPSVYSLEFADERSRWTLELHSSLNRVFHPGAVARLDAEHGCLEPMQLAGRSLLVLRQPLLLLKLACHCSEELDGRRLLRLLEVVRVIRTDRTAGRLDWDDAVSMLRRTRTARYAYPALALAENLAPGTVDPCVLELGRRDSNWSAKHLVSRLIPAGGSLNDRGVLSQWIWTWGVASLLQRLWRILWPSDLTQPLGATHGWRVRLRRIREGAFSLRAPDERLAAVRPQPPRSRVAATDSPEKPR